MRHSRYSVAFGLTTILFVSCKKDDVPVDPTSPPPSANTAMAWAQLKVGNYWIYQRFTTDTAGTETALPVFDSCYVASDTVINGSTYFKMVRPTYGLPGPMVSFQRDSLGFLVDRHGRIIFSRDVFGSVFYDAYVTAGTDTVAHSTWLMTDDGFPVNTPAGTFLTKSWLLHVAVDPDWAVHYDEYNEHTRYAEGIGIVQEVMPSYLSSPWVMERRLVSYHLEP